MATCCNVSDREKTRAVEFTALVCLELFDLCVGVDEVARTMAVEFTASVLSEDVESGKLLDYLGRMDNQALTQRPGLILERLSALQLYSR